MKPILRPFDEGPGRCEGSESSEAVFHSAAPSCPGGFSSSPPLLGSVRGSLDGEWQLNGFNWTEQLAESRVDAWLS